MAEVIKGAAVAAKMKEDMIAKIATLGGVKPCLAIVRVGESAGDLSYEKGVIKTMESVGIEYKSVVLPADIQQAAFEAEFKKVNEDSAVHGILMFRPLPAQLDVEPINSMINPEKDMDCMSPVNMAKLAMGDRTGYYPCTPEAVIAILDYLNVDYQGKNVVIVGHSLVVGRPLGYMMIARDATVTWCHIFTKDTIQHCKDADIIVSAAGKAGLISKRTVEHASKDCIIVDVGINAKPDGTPGICGDVAFEEVEPLVGKITPVPGGVGSVTSVVMASHVVRAAAKACGK